MDLRGEQLGQGAAGRLLPAGATSEIEIGIHCEAHAGQHVTLAEQIVAAQTDRFPSRSRASIPPSSPWLPSWSRIRCTHLRRVCASGQLAIIAASFSGIVVW